MSYWPVRKRGSPKSIPGGLPGSPTADVSDREMVILTNRISQRPKNKSPTILLDLPSAMRDARSSSIDIRRIRGVM